MPTVGGAAGFWSARGAVMSGAVAGAAGCGKAAIGSGATSGKSSGLWPVSSAIAAAGAVASMRPTIKDWQSPLILDNILPPSRHSPRPTSPLSPTQAPNLDSGQTRRRFKIPGDSRQPDQAEPARKRTPMFNGAQSALGDAVLAR